MNQVTNSERIKQTVEKIDFIKKRRSKEVQDEINGCLFQISKDLETILEKVLKGSL